MKSAVRVNSPPEKPLVIFDGDCRFCTLWAKRWDQTAGGSVHFLPSQDSQIAERFPEISREDFARSIQLIKADGSVFSGSEAVFRALAEGRFKWPLWCYEKLPGFAPASELLYRIISRNRPFFSVLTRLFLGKNAERG